MGKYSAAAYDHLIVPAQVRLTLGQEYSLRRSSDVIPSAIPIRLVIDTGSRRSTLIPDIINRLKPTPHGPARVETSAAGLATTLFWIRLEFPDARLEPIPELAVARLSMPPNLFAYAGVIGRDLLYRWESFLLEGRRGRFTIRDQPRRWFPWLWR